mgnify:CR=1 FL=1
MIKSGLVKSECILNNLTLSELINENAVAIDSSLIITSISFPYAFSNKSSKFVVIIVCIWGMFFNELCIYKSEILMFMHISATSGH